MEAKYNKTSQNDADELESFTLNTVLHYLNLQAHQSNDGFF